MPKMREWLFGSKPKKVATGTPEMQQFQNALLQQLQQMMGGGGGFQQGMQHFQDMLGPGAFEKFSQPYQDQFQQRVIPGIEEKYAGQGALSSSGFGQGLGAATSDFQSQLAQMFSGMQNQAAGGLMNQFNQMGSQALGYSPFDYKEGMTGIWPQLMAAMLKSGGGGM